jgi:hypothetical protein
VTAGARRVGLLEACDDAALFGLDLWPKQREILAAIEAGPERTWAVPSGRRIGKTTMAAVFALHSCLFRSDLDGMVAPGTTRSAVMVAVNLQQARIALSMARAVLERSPLLSSMLTSETADELRFELPSGARTVLRAMPCSSSGLRGLAVSVAVLDEIAHFASEGEVGNTATAERVYEALAPAVAQFGPEGRVLLISTPFGDQGLLARMYDGAVSGELPDVGAIHLPSWEVNPTLTPEVLAELEAADPSSYAQEFGAEFLQSDQAYLDMSRVLVSDRPAWATDQVRGNGLLQPVVAGIDPSFAADDFGVVIAGRDPCEHARLVVLRAHAIGGRNRDWESTMFEVCDLLRSYGVSRVATDQFSAASVLDRLRREGFSPIVHTMTASSKTEAFSELRARAYAHELECYQGNDGGRRLVAELRRLRTRFSPGSANVYSPRVGGSHGDLASALSLVAYDQRLMRGMNDGVRAGGKDSVLAGLDGRSPARVEERRAGYHRRGTREDPDPGARPRRGSGGMLRMDF